MPPGRARLFVAVDLPPAVVRAAVEIGSDLPGAHWSNPDQLHLTLRFMAAVPEGELEALSARLSTVEVPAFNVRLAGLGVFPPGRKPPRVLWAGVEPAPAVQALKAAIDAALGPDEESAARGFHPHLTLARFRTPPGPALAPYLAAHRHLTSEEWTVAEIVLYRSFLSSDGAHHHPLLRHPLAGC
jgi:2'-5' RNA ligase